MQCWLHHTDSSSSSMPAPCPRSPRPAAGWAAQRLSGPRCEGAQRSWPAQIDARPGLRGGRCGTAAWFCVCRDCSPKRCCCSLLLPCQRDTRVKVSIYVTDKEIGTGYAHGCMRRFLYFVADTEPPPPAASGRHTRVGARVKAVSAIYSEHNPHPPYRH